MSGPLLLGPLALVKNTAVQVTMSAETQAIYVQNYSRFTVLVSFSDTKPTATDSLGDQYDGVLQAGGRDVFYVQSRGASPRERSLNAMGAFSGSVWFMPIDRTSNQSNTGSVSQLNDLWVSAYGPYDPPPPFPGGMPLNVDLSSQPRVVMVPMSLSNWLTGTWSVGDPNPLILRTITPSAAQLAAALCPVYLYYALLTHEANPSSVMRLAIQMQWLDGGGVAVGLPFEFVRGTIAGEATNNSTTPLLFAPTFPFGAIGPMPLGATHATIQLAWLAGTRTIVNFTIALNNDPTNISGPPDIGQRPFNVGSMPRY